MVRRELGLLFEGLMKRDRRWILRAIGMMDWVSTKMIGLTYCRTGFKSRKRWLGRFVTILIVLSSP